MVQWVKGSDLLELKRLTKEQFCNFVKSGQLIPYEPYQRIAHPSPEPFGARRIFPDGLMLDAESSMPAGSLTMHYEEMISKYYILWKREELLAEEPEEHLRKKANTLDWERAFDGQHREIKDEDWESFKAQKLNETSEILKVKREEWPREVQELKQTIAEMQEDLAPSKVWQNLLLTPESQERFEALLLNADYLMEQVDACSRRNSGKRKAATKKRAMQAQIEATAYEIKKDFPNYTSQKVATKIKENLGNEAPDVPRIMKMLQPLGLFKKGRPKGT